MKQVLSALDQDGACVLKWQVLIVFYLGQAPHPSHTPNDAKWHSLAPMLNG